MLTSDLIFNFYDVPFPVLSQTFIHCSLGEAYGKEGLLGKCGSCFKAAEKIYRVVPGVDHPFYTDVFMPLYNKYVTIASAVLEFSKYDQKDQKENGVDKY